MFTLGDDFFTQVLPGISSQLECLRWEDYQLVRGLRLTLQKSPDTAKSAGHLVRRVIDTARRKNPDILVSQMDTFFPHYSEPDAERVLDLMKFLSALEDEILAHIEINPLYPYVPWSHSKDTKRIPDSEIGQLVAGLRESGFEIMDDFGHGEGPEKNRPMLRNDNVVGIGLMANEAVYVSERTDEMTRQIVEIGLGPKFVDVCQKCFLDPRMARIMKPREGNEGNNGMDAIFDEIALCEVTPEIDAHPLFVYKSGKHGARRANVFAKKRVLDARNYPSYEKLRALVPAK